MSSDIWNPWHGCRKYSEGCDHCYMYYLDSERGKSGGEIYRVKTNFNLPLKKDLLVSFINRNGDILIPSGQDCIKKGDTVMIVTTHTGFHDIQDILK